MKKKICQINNIRIYQVAEVNYRFITVTPDNRTLEQFRYLSDAKLSAQNTKDFVVKK
jgi:GH18 family chitinase